MAWKEVQYENGKFRTGSGGGGGSSHDYSTTEHVIGTWVDGKPLYERTITGALSNTNRTDITIFDNTTIIHNVQGRIYNSANALELGAMLNNDYYSAWYQDFAQTGQLALFCSSPFYTVTSNYEATVQYTKTTD